MIKKAILIILLSSPLSAFAYFQVAGTPVRTPGAQRDKLVYQSQPNRLKVNPLYTMMTQKGLLYNNVKRYAKQHGWRVRWHAKRNYHLVRSTQIAGPSFQGVLSQLLSNYPRLKTTYNQRRKRVTIGLRTKR